MGRDPSVSEALVAGLRAVAKQSIAEILLRFRDPEGRRRMTMMQLNVLAGTAVDKISRYENWERRGSSEAGEFVKQLVAGLREGTGVKLELTVERTPERSVEAQEIEVEPKELPVIGHRNRRLKDRRRGGVAKDGRAGNGAGNGAGIVVEEETQQSHRSWSSDEPAVERWRQEGETNES